MATTTDLVTALEALGGHQPNLNALSREELAGMAAALDRISKTAMKLLGPIKAKLRQLALDETKAQPGSILMGEWGGTAVYVVIQGRKVKLRKGIDVPPDLRSYFTEKVLYTPVDDFLERASKTDSRTRSDLNQLVEIKADQPRVCFNPASKDEP